MMWQALDALSDVMLAAYVASKPGLLAELQEHLLLPTYFHVEVGTQVSHALQLTWISL
jgi:hypothetical protein